MVFCEKESTHRNMLIWFKMKKDLGSDKKYSDQTFTDSTAGFLITNDKKLILLSVKLKKNFRVYSSLLSFLHCNKEMFHEMNFHMPFNVDEIFSFNFRRNILELGAVLRYNAKETSIRYCVFFQYHATVKYITGNLEKLLGYNRVF